MVYVRETRSADPLDNPTNRSNTTPKAISQEPAVLKGFEGRRLLIDGDYRDAIAAFAATINLRPIRLVIFHQGCSEVYEKLGEYLRAEADRRTIPSIGPTPHSKWDRCLDRLEDIASKRIAANRKVLGGVDGRYQWELTLSDLNDAYLSSRNAKFGKASLFILLIIVITILLVKLSI